MVVRNARLMDLSSKINLTFWSYSEPLGKFKIFQKGGAFLIKLKGCFSFIQNLTPLATAQVGRANWQWSFSREHSWN